MTPLQARLAIPLFIAFSATLGAQVDRAVLNGTVTDPAGAAVPGAKITVQNTATGYTRELVTGDSGFFRLAALPVGSFQVTVSKEGFKQAKFENVQLQVGVTRTLDAQLEVGAVSTSVEVTAAATTLEQTTADIGSVIESRQIKDIPINGRNWSFLMALAPGAVNTGEGTQNSIRFFGRSRDENYWSYDGVDATGIKDPRQEGGLRLVVSLDSIAEFKVNSSSYTAEGGSGAGAQINLVSKSGTNAFHGSAFEYLRNDVFDARRPFDPAQIPDFRLNQFGGNFGGPIVKDRTFFFLNYEGLQQRLGQSAVNGLVPSASFRQRTPQALQSVVNAYPVGQERTSDPDVDRFTGVFRNRWEENSGSARVDHRFNQNHAIFGRFNTTDGNFNDRRSALLEYRESFVRPTNATLQWTALLSPSIVNEVKAGVNRSALTRPQTGLGRESYVIPGFTSTISTTVIQEIPTSYSIVDNFTWNKGAHTIKAGGEIRRIHMNVANGPDVSVRFASRPAFLANQVDRFEVAGNQAMFGVRRTFYFGYVQDEWRVARNFILNLGGRYEYYTVAREVNGRGDDTIFDEIRCAGYCPVGQPWYFADKNNFAPRFGFAYNVAEKTVLRGGYGIYYGPGQNDDVTAALDSEPERLQLTQAQRPGLSYPIIPFIPEARASAVAPRVLQRDRRDFYSQQWSFSIQRELPAAFVGQLAYVGNRGSKLFGRDRVNTLIPGTNVRPLPNFSDLDRKNNWGNSTFHGLQSSLNRTFARGWLFQTQYMYSKIIDDNAGSGDGAEISIPTCRRCERAPADWDVRHTFTANSVYELPFGPGRRYGAKSGFAGKLLEGWDLSGVFTARTGRPFTATIDRATADVPSGSARNQRPNLTGISPIPDVQTPDRYINPAAFSAPAKGTYGNAARNILRAPGLWQMDASLNKRTKLSESFTLDFRAEAFNLFNRPQFGTPASNLSNSNFGIIRTTVNDGATGFGTARSLQFMLRLSF
jgi:hypothetical protein